MHPFLILQRDLCAGCLLAYAYHTGPNSIWSWRAPILVRALGPAASAMVDLVGILFVFDGARAGIAYHPSSGSFPRVLRCGNVRGFLPCHSTVGCVGRRIPKETEGKACRFFEISHPTSRPVIGFVNSLRSLDMASHTSIIRSGYKGYFLFSKNATLQEGLCSSQ